MEKMGRQGRRVFRMVSKGIIETYFGGYHQVMADLAKERVEFEKEKEKMMLKRGNNL